MSLLLKTRIKKISLLVISAIFFIALMNFLMATTNMSDGLFQKIYGYSHSQNSQQFSTIRKNYVPNNISIEIIFKDKFLKVKVNDKFDYTEDYIKFSLLLRVIVVDSTTGRINNYRRFNAELDPDIHISIRNYIKSVYPGHVIILAISNNKLKIQSTVLNYIQQLGSTKIANLEKLENWIFCFRQRSNASVNDKIEEMASEKGRDSVMKYSFESEYIPVKECSTWSEEEFDDRRDFCRKYFSYPKYCQCENFLPIKPRTNKVAAVLLKKIMDIPIVIISSDRPQYLIQHLESLLNANGIQIKNIIINIDEMHPEILGIAELFKIKTEASLAKCVPPCRVAQHYRDALVSLFNKNQHAEEIIIFEEDLIVSPDILLFFDQLIPQLYKDPTIYCISAWNDQGYSHSIKDATMIYRVESMPGLGWVLTRKLFNEIINKWPNMAHIHWDMWMRLSYIILARECLIPDISRTFHIGKYGINIDPFTQGKHFDTRYFFNYSSYISLASDWTSSEKYEQLMNRLTTESDIYHDSQKLCELGNETNNSEILASKLTVEELIKMTRLAYITMRRQDEDKSWMLLFKCLKMWDRDLRGIHKGAIRFWYNNIHYIIIGYPYSDYAKSKPTNHKPFNS